jgi:DNA-binding response OmpR family regulator
MVDDEPRIRRVLHATLSSNGFDVIEAKNGKEAITAVLREHPDLTLLDVNMPGMSGFEPCSKIRMSFGGPIIMVTVRVEEQDKVVAFDSGSPTPLAVNGSQLLYRRAILCEAIKCITFSYALFRSVRDRAIRS